MFTSCPATAMEKPGQSLTPLESESSIGMGIKNVFVQHTGRREKERERARGEAEREKDVCYECDSLEFPLVMLSYQPR